MHTLLVGSRKGLFVIHGEGTRWQEIAAPAFPLKPDQGPWAGCMPAGLFRSEDGGASWALNRPPQHHAYHLVYRHALDVASDGPGHGIDNRRALDQRPCRRVLALRVADRRRSQPCASSEAGRGAQAAVSKAALPPWPGVNICRARRPAATSKRPTADHLTSLDRTRS